MKKVGILKIFALMVLFFSSMPFARGAEILIPDFQIAPGETSVQPVSVVPGEEGMFEYQGFQMDFELPEGITVDYEATRMLGDLSGFDISFNEEINRLIAYTKSQEEAVKSDIELMGVAFRAAGDILPGSYPVNISRVIFSTPRGKDIQLDNSSTTVTVISPTLAGFYLYIPDFEIYRGGFSEARLNLSSGDMEMIAYRGLQFDLVNIPPYLNVDVDKSLVAALGNGFSLSAREISAGHYRFVVFAAGKDVVSTEKNNLISIYFTADKDAPIGEVIISNQGQYLSSVLGQDIVIGTSSTVINILSEPEIPVTSVTISPSTLLLPAGGSSYGLTATVLPENATSRMLSWASSNETVATVDQEGNVTPLSYGYATITATAADGSGVFGSCQVTVYDITLEPSAIKVEKGKVETVTAKIQPEDFTNPEGWNIIWSSSDPAVATVADGVVTGLMDGNCTITAVFGEVSASTMVEVYTNLVSSITLDASSLYIWVNGDAETLTATVEPENATFKTLNWSSDNEAVATVSREGVVTPVAPGYATITVTATDGSGVSASCKVTVYDITLDKSQIDLLEGESESLTATVYPEGFMPEGWQIYWVSSNPSVAVAVTEDDPALAMVNALNAGSCEITVSFGDAFAYCAVNVDAPVMAQIYIAPFSIYAGDSYTAQVKVDHEGTLFEYSGFQFDIEVPEGLDIDTYAKDPSLGTAFSLTSKLLGDNVYRFMGVSTTAVSTSDALMSITFSSEKTMQAGNYPMPITEASFSTPKGADIFCPDYTTMVEVKKVTYSVTVAPSELELQEGTNGKLAATVTAQPADKADSYTVVWESSDPDVATVDENGNVHAVSEGECVITAKVVVRGEVVASDSSDITVTRTPVEPTLTVVPERAEIMVYDTVGLDYVINPKEAGENATVTWTSGNKNIATVDSETGQVYGVSEGECIITATAYDEDGIMIASGFATIIVKSYTVTIEPGELELEEGESAQLEAVVEPDNGGDYHVVWESSDPNVATVDEDGNVTAVGEGECTITGTVYDEDGNEIGSAEATVKVTPKEPQPEYNVTIEPGDLELEEGESAQLEAVIEPPYEGEYHIVWESSDEDVATVDEDGNVTAVGEGDCVITGTVYDEDGNIIGSAEATVHVTKNIGTPEIPVDPSPEGWYGNNNGTYVSEIKIREGNELGLHVNEAIGGYPEGWNYLWFDPQENVLGDEPEIWTTAELYGAAANTGYRQSISDNIYKVNVTDYDYDDNVFWETTLETATVHVYKRPLTPAQLLRKGQSATGGVDTPETGTTHTFVVMMTPLSDAQLSELGYSYVYGYTDRNGQMFEIEETDRRYTHEAEDIYWDDTLTFWVYSQWKYADGSIVTSGLRYLDGGEDPDFDNSDFEGTRTSMISKINAGENSVVGIYSVDGQFVGTDRSRLTPGIYIIRGTKSSQKVVIR